MSKGSPGGELRAVFAERYRSLDCSNILFSKDIEPNVGRTAYDRYAEVL